LVGADLFQGGSALDEELPRWVEDPRVDCTVKETLAVDDATILPPDDLIVVTDEVEYLVFFIHWMSCIPINLGSSYAVNYDNFRGE
jgi:hypothetical protein